MGRRTVKRYDGEEYDGSTPLPEPKEELFCSLFNTNSLTHFWANGQNSYEFAYGYTERIEKLEDKIETAQELAVLPKKQRKGKSIAGLEREIKALKESIRKMRRDCARAANRVLMRPHVKLRSGFMLNALAKDLIVDQELSYLIQQRENLQVKQGAIAHYDKKMQRITDRLDVKHHFDPVKAIRMNAAKKPV